MTNDGRTEGLAPAPNRPGDLSQPEFVDNLDGNTLAEALRGRLGHLVATRREPVDVSVATGYFNPQGFGLIADLLREAGQVKLLLGAEPLPAAAVPERTLGDPRGDRYEAKLTREVLQKSDDQLRQDRDHLPFRRQTLEAIRSLLDFLESGEIEVRRYERRFLHGKAFIFAEPEGQGEGVLAGSSNFTAAGLTANLELNLGHYQPSVVNRVQAWFDRLWAEAVPYDLAAIYQERFADYAPYVIYLRILWERYGEELKEEAEETGRIQLTRFQNDGVQRARRILNRFNGVLIADSVGLGKSFIAAELFTQVIEREKRRALLVAPAQLRDGTWKQFKTRFQVGIEVVSFEQMANAIMDDEGRGLAEPPEKYWLIVIDEAHAFRNPDTKRAKALRRLLRGDPPKRVVMLTATPVNNSLWDLYDLLAYFVEHDAAFADLGIPSLKQRFEEAASEDPFELKPDTLFDILDATTVRRTRHFVQEYYSDDTYELRDGTEVTIQFPEPRVRSRSYDLDDVLPGFFNEFAEALAPEGREPELTLARYWISRYRYDEEVDGREAALVGLIRSGLLKRFESSAQAFVRTLERMTGAHRHILDAMDEGVIPAPEALVQLQETDSDEAWDELLASGDPVDADRIDIEALRRDLENDLELLERFREKAAEVTPERDPKLELLVEELARAAAEADRVGLTEQDIRNRRKVLVFSYFADTAEWIADYLQDRIAGDHRLAAYRGRLAVVRGTESYEGITRSDAVYGFAPESSEAPSGRDADRYDILITTDVLAEGMNLQQCGRIINYDLPWNPMRLVQRHGRIDRIGSPHDDVQITCIFPDQQLDQLLSLEYRIRSKLAQASASIGLDQVVIPGMETTGHVFADERSQLEAIQKGDATLFRTGGEDVHAHSGEEYRQELRNGLERWERQIRGLPWGVGSGFLHPTREGYVFCARVFDRVYLRFVPRDPEEPVERDTLTSIALASCSEETDRVLPEDVVDGAFEAWERARRDIYEEWTEATDPANLQPEIRPLFKAAAQHVRMNPAGLSLEEVDRLADTLEAPRSIRIERQFRDVFDPDGDEGAEATRRIAELVGDLGLQPFKAPEPLPRIEEDEVNLVVWMALQQRTVS